MTYRYLNILNNDKYVLCRPRGGLNDTLCQIELCWTYAEKFGRILAIDTMRSGLYGNFFDFFELNPDQRTQVIVPGAVALRVLSWKSIFPHEINRRLQNYKAVMRDQHIGFVDRETNALLSFDIDRNFHEAVVLHEQSGGGSASHRFFERVRFSKLIRTIIRDRLMNLPPNYTAVHVRNTDYKSDYINTFDDIKLILADCPLLVCSDDPAVLDVAKHKFGAHKVLTVSNINNPRGVPIHRDGSPVMTRLRFKHAVDALVDLFAMARATELYSAPLMGPSPDRSGFSNLAHFLNKNQDILQNLI